MLFCVVRMVRLSWKNFKTILYWTVNFSPFKIFEKVNSSFHKYKRKFAIENGSRNRHNMCQTSYETFLLIKHIQSSLRRICWRSLHLQDLQSLLVETFYLIVSPSRGKKEKSPYLSLFCDNLMHWITKETYIPIFLSSCGIRTGGERSIHCFWGCEYRKCS